MLCFVCANLYYTSFFSRLNFIPKKRKRYLLRYEQWNILKCLPTWEKIELLSCRQFNEGENFYFKKEKTLFVWYLFGGFEQFDKLPCSGSFASCSSWMLYFCRQYKLESSGRNRVADTKYNEQLTVTEKEELGAILGSENRIRLSE